MPTKASVPAKKERLSSSKGGGGAGPGGQAHCASVHMTENLHRCKASRASLVQGDEPHPRWLRARRCLGWRAAGRGLLAPACSLVCSHCMTSPIALPLLACQTMCWQVLGLARSGEQALTQPAASRPVAPSPPCLQLLQPHFSKHQLASQLGDDAGWQCHGSKL